MRGLFRCKHMERNCSILTRIFTVLQESLSKQDRRIPLQVFLFQSECHAVGVSMGGQPYQ